jgi:hypothetical protein
MVRDIELGLKPINEWKIYELANKRGTALTVSLVVVPNALMWQRQIIITEY